MRDPMHPAQFTVAKNRRDLPGLVSLTVEPRSNADRIAFSPGQFNMLYAFGVGEVPISISGDPTAQGTAIVHTIRSVGAVTRALCGLKKGNTLGVRGPFGTPWPLEGVEGEDIIIIAGGLGLAPLRPAIYSVLSRREKYGRFIILYGARSPADLLYARELRDWRGRFDVEVEVTVDRSAAGWRGNVGVVPALISRKNISPEDTAAFLCGPEVMMRFSALELLAAGLPEEGIDPETMTPADVDGIAAARGADAALGLLNRAKVVRLKQLARRYADFPMEARKISRASKARLIEAFKAYYENKK